MPFSLTMRAECDVCYEAISVPLDDKVNEDYAYEAAFREIESRGFFLDVENEFIICSEHNVRG